MSRFDLLSLVGSCSPTTTTAVTESVKRIRVLLPVTDYSLPAVIAVLLIAVVDGPNICVAKKFQQLKLRWNKLEEKKWIIVGNLIFNKTSKSYYI